MRILHLMLSALTFAVVSFPENVCAENKETKKMYEVLEQQCGADAKRSLKAAVRCFKGSRTIELRSSEDEDVLQQAVLLKGNKYSLERLAEAWRTIYSLTYKASAGNHYQEGVYSMSQSSEVVQFDWFSPLGNRCLEQTYILSDEDGDFNFYRLFLLEGEGFSLLLSSEINGQDSLDEISASFHDHVIRTLVSNELNCENVLGLMRTLRE